MSSNYETLYASLQPALQQLENRRKELKQKGTRTGLIVGGIFFILGCIFSLNVQGGTTGLLISLAIALILVIYNINRKSGELSNYYKKDIIAIVIKQLCEETSYFPDKGIPEEIFMSCGLFSTTPDRYRCEDLITGKIAKTKFACSEIIAEEKQVTTDNKGRRQEHWVDIFRGFLFIADFHKNFNGKTVVYRNSWLKLKLGHQRVKLENPDFEKNFDTYSTDQIEARYLLTPGLMEKILELDRKFSGKITISFYNSQVIVAIPDSKDHFETSIWQSQLHNENIEQEFYTLSTLFGIVNDLNLNLRIWTKE